MNELAIHRLHADGSGVGTGPSGDEVIVRGALPGDRVRVGPIRKERRRLLADLEEVTAASPHRRIPACPWDRDCGGCDLAPADPSARRGWLAEGVARTLGLDAPPDVVASSRDAGYRSRIKLSIHDNECGYSRYQSNDLVTVEACGVARPEVREALTSLRGWLAAGPTGGLVEVELRSDGSAVAYAFASRGSVPRAVRDRMTDLGDVALDGRRVAGDPNRTLSVAGLSLRASPRSFYQVNLEINALLVDHVVAQVRASRPERIVDLYAGIGNLTLPLGATGTPVVGVELEGQATADLTANAAANGVDARVVARPVERFDPSTEAFDALVLDPPRAGAPGVLERALRNRPRVVVYVACHAPSAVRDLRAATAAGYRVREVRCFDMFPQTHHIETVVTLDR